jgi:DNA-directed RNA polymerase specialized sigma24 family protein
VLYTLPANRIDYPTKEQRLYGDAFQYQIILSEKDFLLQLKQNQGIIYKLESLYYTSDEDKKDLYQEIVLQALKTYPAFRGDAKFSTWLYRLSINTILTLKKKNKQN